MSVRSKALCIAVVLSLLSSCSTTTSSPAGSGDDFDVSRSSTVVTPELAETDVPLPNAAGDTLAAESGRVEEFENLARAEDIGLGVRLERGGQFTRLLIDTEKPPVFDVLTMTEPPRLVVDLLGMSGAKGGSFSVDNDPYVKSVRVGSHKDRIRVVFDLNEIAGDSNQVDHQIDSQEKQLAVTFKKLGAAEVAPAQEVAALQGDSIEGDAAIEAEGEDTLAAAEGAPEETAAAENAEMARLETLEFEKTLASAGQIRLNLTAPAAFELSKSAPSEYVLRLPGISASEQSKLPQIAPASFPGIRSVRAVERDGEVLVRMFVDDGVTVDAKPEENQILVVARKATRPAQQPDARAQLQFQEGEEAADAAPAEGEPAPSENTARLNPTGVRSADGSKVYTGRLISLDLQDTDIDNALRIIAEVSNLNIIASDDVVGKVTLRLIDVPWDQALDVILKTNGLDQVTEGNVIRIAPVEKLRAEREALLEAKRAAENLEDLTVKYIRVSYARVTDLREQVETVLSERGSVTVDERTNQLIVKDIQKGHMESEALLKRLDLRTPQVLLETQIVEANRNILRDLGFQWNFQYTRSPGTGNATGYNFPNSVAVGGGTADGSGNLQAVNFPAAITDAAGSAVSAILDSADGSRSLSSRLTMLETEGKVRVISRPQVATVNNKEAQIKSVETVRVRLPDSGLSVATGAGASASGGGSAAFEEINVGIELRVTPQASPDYYVLLDIEAQSSTFGSTVVDNIPSTLDRQATSTILVKSGQTFALGGVYRIEDTDQVQGVPFLKDIPFLGHLFRRSFIDKSDEELIFFITPHIVEGSFDPSLM
ncbi:MAG: type IV pilus secretin PilQ [Bdellovibrionales bacterium]|nr:type IV pilus secretin PilQ [Bdellovibrionales bacterium]